MRFRILCILSGIVLLYMGVMYGVHRTVIFKGYLTVEENEAREEVARCIKALQREIDHLDLLTHDWSAWDDTYRFVQDRNEEYIKSNLVEGTFTDNQLDLIYMFNTRHEIVWGEARDPVTREKIELKEFSSEYSSKIQGLFDLDDPTDTVSGIWMGPGVPILIASRPIVKSDDLGPIAGYLVMGRYLSKEYMARLSEQTQVPHRYDTIQNGAPVSFPRDVFDRITVTHPVVVAPADTGVMHIYSIFPDIFDRPALMIEADIPQTIRAQGKFQLWVLLMSTGAIGGLLLLTILVLLNHMVIKPISTLTIQVMSFSDRQRFSLDALSKRRDEVGTLCREFDRMTMQLKTVHEGLKESNRELEIEILEHQYSEHELRMHQEKLRSLSSELVMAQERERRHLAKELHDRIGQALAVLQMQIELLIRSNNVETEEEGGAGRKVINAIEAIIQDSRSLTFEISPPVLYELGLGPAIEWLGEEIAEHHPVHIDVEDHFAAPLEESLRALVFRSVRELLYNVVRHSHAVRAWVILEQVGSDLRVTVKDNGVGFDREKNGAAGKKTSGFGFFSIRERLLSIGGSVEIESAVDGGAMVTLIIPLTLSFQEKAGVS